MLMQNPHCECCKYNGNTSFFSPSDQKQDLDKQLFNIIEATAQYNPNRTQLLSQLIQNISGLYSNIQPASKLQSDNITTTTIKKNLKSNIQSLPNERKLSLIHWLKNMQEEETEVALMQKRINHLSDYQKEALKAKLLQDSKLKEIQQKLDLKI